MSGKKAKRKQPATATVDPPPKVKSVPVQPSDKVQFQTYLEKFRAYTLLRDQAEDEARQAGDNFRQAEHEASFWAVRLARTNQLKAHFAPETCIKCKKRTLCFPDKPDTAQYECKCEWHDHGPAYTRPDNTPAYCHWISVVPKTECIACLYPELMPCVPPGVGDLDLPIE